ncbi:MAG: hypothetical protein FDZ69_11150 [Deltaproteobacteria bacterium]|nr:MAG: hypothetical protein FDZ69_11150 [Deltaproteobacteria bacterium]
MAAPASVSSLAARLAADLCRALLGQGVFTPGRPEVRQALGALYDGLGRQFREQRQIVLLGGPPPAPADFSVWGFGPERLGLADLLADREPVSLQHLAGFWRDRRLVLLSLRAGIGRQEFETLVQLFLLAGDRGTLSRRWLDERLRGNLPHAVLLFVDDLRDIPPEVSWPVQAALAWLLRDINLLSRQEVPPVPRVDARQALFDAVLELAAGAAARRDLLAHLDLISEALSDYDRDEFAGLLLARFDMPALAAVCLDLCGLLERLQQRVDRTGDTAVRSRIGAVRWIARRVTELLIDAGAATPAHYHALVLQKVLLYEEIPEAMRARVAALQVLTSFLTSPQRYFAEIEGSHSAEVLEKRLWRLLEMLPNMLRAFRFDAARDTVIFSRRFGATFDLTRNPELLAEVRETAAAVLVEGGPPQQAELMQALPQMGPTGLHLLIDLADHPLRPVRRAALDGLCAAGPAVVPVLFEALERKDGWHYLRNMLIILGKVAADGGRVEEVFLTALAHPEPGIRKEALPGVARLLKGAAAGLVAQRLDDSDPEVRRRAVVCLGHTGIADPRVYARLAELLAVKDGTDMKLAVLATLKRLQPGSEAGERIESALVNLAGGGWFGLGRAAADRTVRVEAIRTLGQFGSGRARKTLERLLKEDDPGVVRAAQETLLGGR